MDFGLGMSFPDAGFVSDGAPPTTHPVAAAATAAAAAAEQQQKHKHTHKHTLKHTHTHMQKQTDADADADVDADADADVDAEKKTMPRAGPEHSHVPHLRAHLQVRCCRSGCAK